KGATTEDIKKLGNSLPTSIKDALKDFFTDGSMPHLEAIRGTLQASTILQADSNDKLDSISSSTDAGLILQSDANGKLDSTNTKLDSIKSSLDGGNGVSSSSLVDDSDFIPNSSAVSSITALSNDLSTIKQQFENTKNLVSGNFTPPTFSSGSCPTVSGPAGLSFNPSQIGSLLSPYSPIISILVYISLMFMAFGSVFKFLSRGPK
ncbi:MAG: hypothetical protein J0647_09825, partial [Campylobacteraceae bacterium]|nr:hypothetical protein [Campylobacteraceae bacterium]